MNAWIYKHLEFIPAYQFENWDGDPRAILIYTSRINGRNYKKKRELVGEVTAFTDRKKGEQWRFCQANHINLVADTIIIIAKFLEDMNTGRVVNSIQRKEKQQMTVEEAIKRLRQETCPATYNKDFNKEECLKTIEVELEKLRRPKTVQEVVDSMTKEQKQVLYDLIKRED